MGLTSEMARGSNPGWWRILAGVAEIIRGAGVAPCYPFPIALSGPGNILDIYVLYMSIGMQLGWNYSVW